MYNILVVDDEKDILTVVKAKLEDNGYRVWTTMDGPSALEIAKSQMIDLVITDIKMQPMDGITLMEKIQKLDPEIKFIMITAYGEIKQAVECMKKGAYDYITKPFGMDEILFIVNKALEHTSLVRENLRLKKELTFRYQFSSIIGKSLAMQKIYGIIEKVASTDTTVLICGESGTGKELVARAIHYNSPRKNAPFVAVNCGGVPESLLESELFGHVKGAFTGASTDKDGLFFVANGGSIFLDEIASTTPSLQVSLLRVLQEREIKRVGDTKYIPVDVRVIAATNKSLEEEVKKGNFREDLFYRLSVIPIELPPLRERKEDIPLLVEHFLEKHALDEKRHFSPEAMKCLLEYDWPGNVRELENVVERAIIVSERDIILPEDLPENVNLTSPRRKFRGNLKEYLLRIEQEYIREVLRHTQGNKKMAAKLLGIDIATLYRKLSKG